jgi:hypothetical protein
VTTGQPDCLQLPTFNPSSHCGLAYHTVTGNVLNLDPFLHDLTKAANRCKLTGLFIGTQTPYPGSWGVQICSDTLSICSFGVNGACCGFRYICGFLAHTNRTAAVSQEYHKGQLKTHKIITKEKEVDRLKALQPA